MGSVLARAGKYKIEEFLGEGLNSCVYHAFKESDKLNVRFEVALKILKSEKMVSVWRNEFERLCQINSEHCVKLLGWEDLETGPALILEYVKGVNLFELQKAVSLTEAEVDEVVRQSRRGLEHLAEQVMFHGDLSPQNIMIDDAGVVKLVDFGISAEQKNHFLTPRYAAPSVLMGQKPSLVSDLESLELIRQDLLKGIGQSRATNSGKSVIKSLANKVRWARARRQKAQSRTQPVQPMINYVREIQRINNLSIYRYLRSMVIPIFFLISLISRGDSKAELAIRPVRLTIHSAHWLSVSIDGHFVGYAPIDISVKSGRQLRLGWQTATAKGEKLISLNPGQIINLNEKSLIDIGR